VIGSNQMTRALMLGFVAVICACQNGRPPFSEFVEDSAGIAVVRVGAVTHRSTIAAEPRAVIGADESNVAAILSGIRDLAALENGSIAIADRDRSVRVFADDGELVHRFGGWGEGPGEFKEISVVKAIRADTLVIVDASNRTATFTTRDGNFVRRVPLTPETPMAVVFDVTDDGRFIGIAGLPARVESSAADGVWARAEIVLIDPNRASVDTIGSFIAFPCKRDVMERCAPDALATPLRAFREGAIVANADDNRLVGYGDDGRVQLIVELGDVGSVREIVHDRNNGIWLEAQQQDGGATWLHVDLERGTRVAVTQPEGMSLMAASGVSTLVALHRDSLGVQTVRILEVVDEGK
jgi:hypothetical protein